MNSLFSFFWGKCIITGIIFILLFGEVNNSFADSPDSTSFVWTEKVVWYQIFPERFRNGDKTNDPELFDQEGCWPHELIEPWQIHPWKSDWFELQAYEKINKKDLWYNITRRRYGGDIQGIIDKLDYLKDMGIGAIYLNPIFVSPSHHKYDIAYYHHIEPTFGPNPKGDKMIIEMENPINPAEWVWTSADRLVLKLINEIHKRDMKIIFDGVFNHVGYNNFAFRDVMENQENSDFKDWFTINSWEDSIAGTHFGYEGWWGVKDMPEIREDSSGMNKNAEKYIFDITQRWMDPDNDGDPSDGIDGWRLDVAFCVGHPFWKKWRELVKFINPDSYLTAEIIDSPEKLILYLEGDEFDAVMNYNFTFYCSSFFITERGGVSVSHFDYLLNDLRAEFPEKVSLQMLNLLGSHDTDRPSSRIVNRGLINYLDKNSFFGKSSARNQKYKNRKPNNKEYEMLKLMSIFQMTYPGAPMIYYGDEVGMWGANDPSCRKPMLWEDKVYDNEKYLPKNLKRKNADKVEVNIDLLNHYKKIINIRNTNPELQSGDFKVLLINDKNRIYAFSRTLNNESIIVVINNDINDHNVELNIGAKKSAKDILNNKNLNIKNEQISIPVNGKWAAIIKVEIGN
ncbi:MAG: glycoside hydrolase family 13 protein [Bacteroidales bacterium]|nr:glycoside hydrolase family 13 protein [Bacteroidales bacterium]